MQISWKWVLAGALLTAGAAALSGCAPSRPVVLANELTFALDRVGELELSYDEEAITFLEADGPELVIREYMSDPDARFGAKVRQSPGSIRISEGRKPLLHAGFERYIEVLLPAGYAGSLTVTTTEGAIDLGGALPRLQCLRAETTSGEIRIDGAEACELLLATTSGSLQIGRLQADRIELLTTSGTAVCEALDGSVVYNTTSGSLEVAAAEGAGIYQASQSGGLRVTYAAVRGDLRLYNKNGDIRLTLPKDLAFRLEAATKNGEIAADGAEGLRAEGGRISGAVGGTPGPTVHLETKNGDIYVTR